MTVDSIWHEQGGWIWGDHLGSETTKGSVVLGSPQGHRAVGVESCKLAGWRDERSCEFVGFGGHVVWGWWRESVAEIRITAGKRVEEPRARPCSWVIQVGTKQCRLGVREMGPGVHQWQRECDQQGNRQVSRTLSKREGDQLTLTWAAGGEREKPASAASLNN